MGEPRHAIGWGDLASPVLGIVVALIIKSCGDHISMTAAILKSPEQRYPTRPSRQQTRRCNQEDIPRLDSQTKFCS
jgi:hypothetical protein